MTLKAVCWEHTFLYPCLLCQKIYSDITLEWNLSKNNISYSKPVANMYHLPGLWYPVPHIHTGTWAMNCRWMGFIELVSLLSHMLKNLIIYFCFKSKRLMHNSQSWPRTATKLIIGPCTEIHLRLEIIHQDRIISFEIFYRRGTHLRHYIWSQPKNNDSVAKHVNDYYVF